MSFVGSYKHSLDAKKRVFIPSKFREELGDVMLQVVFHTQMENELGNFNIDDVDIQNESLEDIIRGIYEED